MIFRRVVMAASSVAAQRAFYDERLGLPVTTATDAEVGIQAGETELVFREASPGEEPSYHFAIRVPGDRFREAKEWLRERSALLTEDGVDEFPWDFWGARAVYTLDPAGNVVELIAFRGLDDADELSLLGVAEMGLPVRDVHEAIELLSRTFGVGFWDRDRPSPDRITPLGERGATFIAVTLGRPWFLGEAAGDHPLEVELAGVQTGELRLPGQRVQIIAR